MIFSVSQQTDKKNGDIFSLEITTKDFRTLKFQILFSDQGNDIYDNIRNLAFPGMFTDSCFASKYCSSFSKPIVESSMAEVIVDYNRSSLTNPELFNLYFKQEELPEDGWDVYKYRIEFSRQGVRRPAFKKLP